MARIKFEELTKAEQRVVIAKDLIARLKAKKFTALSGTYLMAQDVLDDEDGNAQVRDVLKGQECRGCQIGGMFLCAIDRYDRLKVRDVGDSGIEDNDGAFRKYLSRWFSADTLTEVEEAFEGCGKFEDWFEENDNDEIRMVKIAQNIIRNKGKFIGSQLLNS